MKNYQDLIQTVFDIGYQTDDRTGTGTIATFGTKVEWDMSEGFPATTVKRLAYKSVVGELLWFLEGSTNVERLREITHGAGSDKKTIWDQNFEAQGRALGYVDGELGPVYGKQWRDFGGVDQLVETIEKVKKVPTDRRQIVSAWNPAELKQMALPPCHLLYQFNVHDGELDLLWYQRSVDVFLGLPFDIGSYGTLLHIVAKMTGLKPGKLVFMGGNTHIYLNHIEQCKEVLRREPKTLPTLKINWPEQFHLWDTEMQLYWVTRHMSPADFVLENYEPHPTIAAPMAV
ncbi:thymidylate synthase [Shigella phage SP18]|uniref:Thymidylate synthase n=1 Tax=Shigella phage SP18 TaxID=645664 RepID=E3SF49_BPSP8|nr:thymidylate synthase [Shigella phage SP18]ADO19586.1 thymidylate synthase [Shigella phage SP18]